MTRLALSFAMIVLMMQVIFSEQVSGERVENTLTYTVQARSVQRVEIPLDADWTLAVHMKTQDPSRTIGVGVIDPKGNLITAYRGVWNQSFAIKAEVAGLYVLSLNNELGPVEKIVTFTYSKTPPVSTSPTLFSTQGLATVTTGMGVIMVVAILLLFRRRRASKAVNKLETVQKTKPANREFIRTGLDDLDRLLLGGIPKGYAAILTSPSCDERDLLLHRFLENCLQSTPTFLVSTTCSWVDDLIQNYPKTFHTVICNPQADILGPRIATVYRVKHVQNLSEVNITLLDGLKKAGAGVVLIDILSEVLLYHDHITSRKWLEDLLPRIKANETTIISTLNPQMHSKEAVQTITDLFDGHIEIYERELRKRTRRLLTVRRFGRRGYLDTEILLDKGKL